MMAKTVTAASAVIALALCLGSCLGLGAGARASTGIDYDRVLPLSHIERHDGSSGSAPSGLGAWKQMYSEVWRASVGLPTWPSLADLVKDASGSVDAGVIPIVVMNFKYDAAGLERRVFAATAMKEYTYRGARVVFGLDPRAYFSNDTVGAVSVEADFSDGAGWRRVGPAGGGGDSEGDRYTERHITVTYSECGAKRVRVRMAFKDGTVLRGAFDFQVRSLETPSPDDTLAVTASIPYAGQYGTGRAYIYLGDGHGALTNPVIVAEGFDIDNTMGWDELYALLNQQGLVESLRTDGYDAVVLDFTDATDYIQRNSFVLVELIAQVLAAVGPAADLAIVGPSMGGLCARYALAYMEANALEHRARTYVSFDSPHTGANIPLGVQYWMLFFSSESEDAAYMLGRLSTPAARQMLVYHFTDPPTTAGQPDPLRAAFLADLAAVGDYPAGPRKVAVANGSGSGADQGYAAGDQLIFYEYNSFLVDIRGNVWAVPDQSSRQIFEGLVDMIWPLPDSRMNVSVTGTRPYDSAPGGWRASMATMDTSAAPYGDIVALHDAHCFIPTVSALSIATDDLFYDIAGDTNLAAHTPFDTLYYPAANQEHVTITPESAVWFRTEIGRGAAAGVGSGDRPPGLAMLPAYPNPSRSSATIRYFLARSQWVHLDIIDVAGRKVADLKAGLSAAGVGEVRWDGLDCGGRRVAAGVYFCRLATPDGMSSRPVVMLK
ncbi:MAG: FlgD immunoglobulin-like domain containing protein [bacterium]